MIKSLNNDFFDSIKKTQEKAAAKPKPKAKPKAKSKAVEAVKKVLSTKKKEE